LVNDLNTLADEVDETLKQGAGNRFREAAAAYEATDREVAFVDPLDKRLNYRGQNSDDDDYTFALGRTMDDIFLIRNDLQHGDMMLVATHEALVHGPERGAYTGDLLQSTRNLDFEIWFQLPRRLAAPMWAQILWPRR